MRTRFALLLGLLAPAAVAQAPDSLASNTPPAQRPPRAELYLGGLVGSYVVVTVVNGAVGLVSSEAAADGYGSLIGLPAGAALGVIGTGRLLGLDGSAGGAVRGAVRGALFGYGVAFVMFTAIGDRFPFGVTDEGLDAVLFLTAVGAVAVLPTVFAARGYTAVPVQVRAPDGTTAPGVALRVRL